jgi:hypothetical protein
MSLRRLSVLQWIGILAGGTAWWISYLAGVGAATAACNPGTARWDIPHDLVEGVITGVALLLIAGAEIAALLVFRATRNVEEEDPPPQGRLHFFASAALVSNVIFFMVILLAGIATIVDRTCHQS